MHRLHRGSGEGAGLADEDHRVPFRDDDFGDRHAVRRYGNSSVRRTVDALEYLVDDGRWPLPKYREMLFIY